MKKQHNWWGRSSDEMAFRDTAPTMTAVPRRPRSLGDDRRPRLAAVPASDRVTEKSIPVVIDPEAPAPVPVQARIIEKSIPVIDDAARADGGKTTEDKRVPAEELEKIERNAVDHSRDEPGS